MKIKTSELTGAALNWVVASVEWPNDTAVLYPNLTDKQSVNEEYNFSKDGANLLIVLMGRERISVDANANEDNQITYWTSYVPSSMALQSRWIKANGANLVEAVLRCYVTNKLGGEVEVPNHFL